MKLHAVLKWLGAAGGFLRIKRIYMKRDNNFIKYYVLNICSLTILRADLQRQKLELYDAATWQHF